MRFPRYPRSVLALSVIAFLLLVAIYVLYEDRSGITLSHTVPAASIERLRIPSIGVDAVIEHVALTPDGAMDTPQGPRTVGWYSLGPYPGEEGSAVIAGHRGWKDGVDAVFDDLDALKKGDSIVVINSDGEERTFVVRETRVYERDSMVPEVFISGSGVHLNLITCVGEWDRNQQSAEERLVVFADLVF